MEKLSCDNNEQTILEIFKVNNAVYPHNQQKLKRSLDKRKRDNDKKKEAKAYKQSKRSDIEETPPIKVSHRCFKHGGGSLKFDGGLKSKHGGAWGGA